MTDLEWAEVKQRAEAAGETASSYLLRRALAEDGEARLRAALLKAGTLAFEIVAATGSALKKPRKARILIQTDQ